MVESPILEATPPEVQEPTFEELVAQFTYTPTTDEGKGFLPIIGRSVGHILYLVGRYEEKTKPTGAKAKEEIEGALRHWDNLVVEDYLSAKAKGDINIIDSILRTASNDIESWTTEQSSSRLQMIANRMTQLLANLDREILGIRGSDAGLNL